MIALAKVFAVTLVAASMASTSDSPTSVSGAAQAYAHSSYPSASLSSGAPYDSFSGEHESSATPAKAPVARSSAAKAPAASVKKERKDHQGEDEKLTPYCQSLAVPLGDHASYCKHNSRTGAKVCQNLGVDKFGKVCSRKTAAKGTCKGLVTCQEAKKPKSRDHQQKSENEDYNRACQTIAKSLGDSASYCKQNTDKMEVEVCQNLGFTKRGHFCSRKTSAKGACKGKVTCEEALKHEGEFVDAAESEETEQVEEEQQEEEFAEDEQVEEEEQFEEEQQVEEEETTASEHGDEEDVAESETEESKASDDTSSAAAKPSKPSKAEKGDHQRKSNNPKKNEACATFGKGSYCKENTEDNTEVCQALGVDEHGKICDRNVIGKACTGSVTCKQAMKALKKATVVEEEECAEEEEEETVVTPVAATATTATTSTASKSSKKAVTAKKCNHVRHADASLNEACKKFNPDSYCKVNTTNKRATCQNVVRTEDGSIVAKTKGVKGSKVTCAEAAAHGQSSLLL